MKNKDYYASENKSVREMMDDFTKSGYSSYDEWLNSERFSFSDDICYISDGGIKMSPSEAYFGPCKPKYACIDNATLRKNNACFKVLLDDLDGKSSSLKQTEWSLKNNLEKSIPMMEDGVISGKEITDIVKNCLDISDFPAFEECVERGGFLPTVFQFNHLWKHKDEISKIMIKNGWKNPFWRDCWYWTSCQYSATRAWLWYSGGDWYNSGKATNYTVLPFFAVV